MRVCIENDYRPYYQVGINFRLGYQWEKNIPDAEGNNKPGNDKQGMLFGVNVDAALSKWFPIYARP
jgi:hypothetical protein